MAAEDDIPPLEDIPEVKNDVAKPSIVKQVETPVTEKSFAGMKKGFLNSSSSSKTKCTEIIEISRRKEDSNKDFRVLDEVQQAMKDEEQQAMKDEEQSKNSWLTNDLLKQIEDDEYLSRYFSNPFFIEAITLFQHKPQEALAKYGHNAEVMTFFNRMSQILGTHFSSIADKEEKQKSISTDPEVNKLLQDEQTRQLLLDPEVIQLIKLIREQPDRAQWIMRTADTKMRSKIQRLIELGLLNVV